MLAGMIMGKKNNELKISLDDVLDVNIEIVLIHGSPALQFRKAITACDKNLPVVQNIITKALDTDSEVLMPVRLNFYNKHRAIGRLKNVGLLPNGSNRK